MSVRGGTASAMRRTGVLTISIDVELAWGRCDIPLTSQEFDALSRERVIIQRLLALFATYQVQATWAIVGHLMLTDCPRQVLKMIGEYWYQRAMSAKSVVEPLAAAATTSGLLVSRPGS